MDKKLEEWRASMSEKERQLHELASVMLKKTFSNTDTKNDNDNGSYFPEKSHAFRSWLKGNQTK
jgi:hypothetical protein